MEHLQFLRYTIIFTILYVTLRISTAISCKSCVPSSVHFMEFFRCKLLVIMRINVQRDGDIFMPGERRYSSWIKTVLYLSRDKGVPQAVGRYMFRHIIVKRVMVFPD